MKDTIRTRCSNYFATMLFVLVDYVVIVVAEKVACAVYGTFTGMSHSGQILSPSFMFGLIPIVFMSFLQTHNVYGRMRPTVDMVRDIFTSIASGCFVLIVMMYFLGGRFSLPWSYMLLLGSLLLVATYILRYVVYKLLKQYNLLTEPIVIIGAQKTAQVVMNYFQQDLMCRYKLVGIIDDCPENLTVANLCLLMGTTNQAEQIIRDSGVQTVLITAPGMDKDKLTNLISRIQPYVRNISYVPDLIGTPMAGVNAQVLFSEKVLMLQLKNNLARLRNRLFKRCFDLFCTLTGGLLILPILIVIALLIFKDNKGNVIFAHQRVGRNGKLFPCYKFQTMVPDAQAKLEEYLKNNPEARKEWEDSFKLTNDPRVTKLGAFLRKTSLDELPQLWNVIRGDMSLVGPRPIVTKEIKRYGEHFREYSIVLPGITGMWQASGRSDTTYEERVAMDTWYVRNWSVWIDLVYLFKTFKAVFCGKGAY